MPLTIGLTGMDPATESSLRAVLTEATAHLDGQWQVLPEAEAEHVLVDMDSMYGPMSWLRLHAAGKQVVGLTSAPRTLTPYRLARPFDVGTVLAVLQDIAGRAGAPSAARPPVTATPAMPTASLETPESLPATAPPPTPVAAASEVARAAVDTRAIDTPAIAAPAAPAAAEVALPGTAARQSTSTQSSARPRSLLEWLSPGALSGKRRLARSSGPTLLIDADTRVYYGPAMLKPLGQYFDGTLSDDALAAVDPAQWQRETATAGAAQPLSRLVWLGALLAGNGALMPPLDANGRYQLNKWPQTEREFPKHFRIATAMMKGPASVAEIAEASSLAVEDVADFINANLATGYAEVVQAPAAASTEPGRSGGLLGRLRKR